MFKILLLPRLEIEVEAAKKRFNCLEYVSKDSNFFQLKMNSAPAELEIILIHSPELWLPVTITLKF